MSRCFLAPVVLTVCTPFLLAQVPTAPARILKGHTKGVFHITWSPDGKLLASASKDNTIRLWDAATGQFLRTLSGHTNVVYSTAFSSDNKFLASASEDRSVRIWNVADGKVLHSLYGHAGDVYNVGWSPDGRTLASCGDDQTVRLWDVAAGKEKLLLKGHTDRVLTVAFSSDGRRLVSSCATANKTSDRGGEIKVWEVEYGEELYSLPAKNRGIMSVRFSPDGRRLAGADLQRCVKTWELASGLEVQEFKGHTQEVYHVAFAPDGRRLASCSGKWNENKPGEVKLWDLATGRELANLGGYRDVIWSVDFSPCGRWLATANGKWSQGDPGEVWIWDLEKLPALESLACVLTPAELEAHWAALGGNDAPKAHQAVWKLSGNPEAALALLQQRVQPPMGNSIEERLPKLLDQLDAEDFQTREKASEELAKLGLAARPALRRIQESSPSAEVRRRAALLLEIRGEYPPLSLEEVRALRIIEILQKIGTPATRPLLERLASGAPGAPVTQAAQAALK